MCQKVSVRDRGRLNESLCIYQGRTCSSASEGSASNKIIQKRRFPFRSIISSQAARPWSCWGGSGAGSGKGGRSRTPRPAPWIPPRAVPPLLWLLLPTPTCIPELAGLCGAGFLEDRACPPSRPAHSPAKKPLERCDSWGAAVFRVATPSLPAGFCVPPSRLPPAHPAQLSGPLPATSPSLSHYIVI